jgi:hypothetical protein
LARRLTVVQAMLRTALDQAPAGQIVLVSICAGQARDIVGVVPQHPRRADVRGRLVELDPHNASVARSGLATHGLTGLTVLEADAGSTDSYAGVVPADIVLACGVWGNVADEDVHGTVAALPALCRPGATVIWTRHRRPPDLTPAVRRWLGEQGFQELDFCAPADAQFTVGSHRYEGPPREFASGVTMFRFLR